MCFREDHCPFQSLSFWWHGCFVSFSPLMSSSPAIAIRRSPGATRNTASSGVAWWMIQLHPKVPHFRVFLLSDADSTHAHACTHLSACTILCVHILTHAHTHVHTHARIHTRPLMHAQCLALFRFLVSSVGSGCFVDALFYIV